MIPKGLFKKVRRIQITTNRLVSDVFAGQYHSVFKGRGMEFDEVREYLHGDDIRAIDWNVTARTGRPHIKKYIEERELTVMVMVDASASCRFSTTSELKNQLAAEVAALLAFSAIRNNDKVGLIIFTDGIEKYVPPRKGTGHVLRVIREILYFQPNGTQTNISGALDFLNRVCRRGTVSFLISDFYETNPLNNNSNPEPDYKNALAMAGKRHDLVAVTLNDPAERELPDCAMMMMEDAETGALRLVDTSDRRLRKEYQSQAVQRLYQRKRLFGSVGMDVIDVCTSRPYADDLIKFFLSRRQHRRCRA